MRGKHESPANRTFFLVTEEVNEFLSSLPSEGIHYGNNPKARYLNSEFKSIQNIHRIFIDMFPEHIYDVKYRLFRELFIKSGLIIGKPKCDICSVCDGFQIQILNMKKNKKFESIDEIENKLNFHKSEANEFYELKSKLKTELLSNESQALICYDFMKNLQMPITNVKVEYYLRKFHFYNFGIHDLKTNKVVMYLYLKNYAKKGANEVISFISHYINNYLGIKVKVLNVFSDNCFSQNKNKY